MFRCRSCNKEHATTQARQTCEEDCDYRCETCACGPGAKHVATEERPDEDTIAEWIYDGVAQSTDGCTVEPDGKCPHGHRSWLLVMGLI